MNEDLENFVGSLPGDTSARREQLRGYLQLQPASLATRFVRVLEQIKQSNPEYVLDLVEVMDDGSLSCRDIVLRCQSVQYHLRALAFSGNEDVVARSIRCLVSCPQVDKYGLLWDLGVRYGEGLPTSALPPLVTALSEEAEESLDGVLGRFGSAFARLDGAPDSGCHNLLQRVQRETKLLGFENMIGTQLRKRFWDFLRGCSGSQPIWLLGESTVGKTFVANLLHLNLGNGEFVKVDCGELRSVKQLTERIQEAIDGTLFLDEVQVLASRASIQQGALIPLRENEDNILVIAATNEMTENQQGESNPLGFKPAFWRRIGLGEAFTIDSLRDRSSDLRQWILAEAQKKYIRLHPSVVESLVAGSPFGNNIRDVRHLVAELASKARTYVGSCELDERLIVQIREQLSAPAKAIIDQCF